jgi:hypothetical protein
MVQYHASCFGKQVGELPFPWVDVEHYTLTDHQLALVLAY